VSAPAAAPDAEYAATVDIEKLLAALTLDEKVLLLTGRDSWATHALPSIGLESMLLSDGPSGVRGALWDERDPSLNLPCGTTLASSWDVGLARAYGVVAASEARRKNVHVVLGPTINLHRSPLGGRHFEAFSEDPMLTGELAAGYVEGVQSCGVAACPKHYVANDSETERFSVDVQVSSQALREVYLPAFEPSIVDAGAWTVMSAYNSVNGSRATESDLLTTPLVSEWGFDGVVISDWGAVRTLTSAESGQTLVMPGPHGPWGRALLDAVRDGSIPESRIDDKTRRLLLLAARVGALPGTRRVYGAPSAQDGATFARRAAIEGSVLLRNDGVLPLDPATSIAVIGQHARVGRTQGGGSATVVPAAVSQPLPALRAAFPRSSIAYAPGVAVEAGLEPLSLGELTHPSIASNGIRVRFIDPTGALILEEHRLATSFVWLGDAAPLLASSVVVAETDYRPTEAKEVHFGISVVGQARIWVDDTLILDEDIAPEGDDLWEAVLNPPVAARRLLLEPGHVYRVRAEISVGEHNRNPLEAILAFTLGTMPVTDDEDALIEEAARIAATADVALVFVGTSAAVESEGFDRTQIALPGRQDDMVRATARANPRTVVVVNAGAPIAMPWRDEVAAVLVVHFPGQEYGAALADIVSGRAEPGGRLTTTWAAALEEAPVSRVVPDDGALQYQEGVRIGYRAWAQHERLPAYAFGHGLGYTAWQSISVEPALGAVRVGVSNIGSRAGKTVLQLFARHPEHGDRVLVGFTVVRASAGEATIATVRVHPRALRTWTDDGWAPLPVTVTCDLARDGCIVEEGILVALEPPV
jgi:beta-glucosidase